MPEYVLRVKVDTAPAAGPVKSLGTDFDKATTSIGKTDKALKGLDGSLASLKKGSDSARAMTTAAASAASALQTFATAASTGTKGAERQLAVLNVRTDELRTLIERARAAGAPVSPIAIATLKNLEEGTERYTLELGRMRLAQERARDASQDATLAQGGLAGGIRSTSDLLGVFSNRLEQNAIKLGVVAGAVAVVAAALREFTNVVSDTARAAGIGEESIKRFEGQMKPLSSATGIATLPLRRMAEAIGMVVSGVKLLSTISLKDLSVMFGGKTAGDPAQQAAALREYIKTLSAYQQARGRDLLGEQESAEMTADALERNAKLIAAQKKAREDAAAVAVRLAAEEKRYAASLAATSKEMALEVGWRARLLTAAKLGEDALKKETRAVEAERAVFQATRQLRTADAASVAALALQQHAYANATNDVVEARKKELEIEKQMKEAMAGLDQRRRARDDDQAAANAERIAKDLKAQREAGEEMARYIREPMVQAWQAMKSQALDAITEIVMTGKLNFGDLIKSWLAMWFRAMAEWLVRYIVTQRAAQASNMATSASGAASGGGGGGMGWLSGLFGGGGSGGSAASGMSATTAGALGTVAIFAAVYFGVKQWIKTHKQHWDALTIVGTGEGNLSAYGVQGAGYERALSAAGEVIAAIKALVTGLGGQLQSLAGIELGRTGQGKSTQWYVKYASGLIERFGADQQAAMEFAVIQAVKEAKIENLSPLVQDAIRLSTAKNIEQFQRELAFAQTLATQNLPSGAADVSGSLSLARDQWQQAVALFGQDMEAFSEAALSILTRLGSSLWDTYNSLTGREEDPKVAAERNRVAFNAQRALVLAQLTLWKLELEARRANFNGQRLLLEGQGQIARGMLDLAGGMLKAASMTKPLIDEQLAALDAAIAAVNAAIAAVPPEIGEGEGGGRRRGNGRGAARRQQTLDDQATLRGNLTDSARGRMTDFARGMAEINDRWEDGKRLAHGNAELLAQVNRERRIETRLLKERALASIDDRTAALGGAGFMPTAEIDQVRSTAAGLRVELAELAAVGVDVTAQLIAVGEAEKFRLAQIGSGIMDRLFGYLKGNEQFEAQRQAHEKAKLDLEFKLIEAQLRALNMWDAAAQEIFNAARDAASALGTAAAEVNESIRIKNPEWWERNFPGDRFNEEVARKQEEQARLLADVNQALRDFKRGLALDELSPLTPMQRLAEAERAYRATFAAANAGDLDAAKRFPTTFTDFFKELKGFGGTDARYLAYWNEGNALLDQLIAKTGGAGAAPLTVANFPGPTATQQEQQMQQLSDAVGKTQGATEELQTIVAYKLDKVVAAVVSLGPGHESVVLGTNAGSAA